MNKMVKISIVVIFDQLRDDLFRLLETIRPQLNKEVEILLVQESDKEIQLPALPVKTRHIIIPQKQGFSFNRNQGIKNSKGNIIVFIDDDCWVHEKWLEAITKPLLDNKNVMVTASGTIIPKSTFLGDCISELGFPGGGSLGFRNVWPISQEGFTDHLVVGNCAIKKEVFNKIGMFEEAMKSGAEDAEMSMRLKQSGIHILYVEEAYAYHKARTKLGDFIKWQIRRGRANFQFKTKLGKVDEFVKLRLWSTKNIIKKNLLRPRLAIILCLLILSFLTQNYGYLKEKSMT